MELIVQTTLPSFSGNYEALKAQMLEGIKQYEIDVTEENLSEAKKMATELNKLSTVINKVKIEKVKEISGPIDIFKAQVTELIDICQSGREKILVQVKVFEDKTRAIAKDMMDQEYAAQLDAAGIRPEFRNETINDLVTLSCVSKSGKLTKGAKDSVTAKVATLKALQDRVDMRLLQLENAGLKAGLKSSLRREHVEAYLLMPDEQYEIELQRIIGIEVQRQAETEAKLRTDLSKRPIRFFSCVVCHHVVTEYDLPPRCPRCPSNALKEHQTLAEAQSAGKPATPPAPTLPPPPMPVVPQAPAPAPAPVHPVWNQERLLEFRNGVGDKIFFQMFKIVYQPISDRAIQEAIENNPNFNLTAGLEWAKGF